MEKDMNASKWGWWYLRLGALCLALGAVLALVSTTGGQPTAAQAGRDIIITLKNDFIEKYKNLVTIEANFTVDKAGKIHPPREDGDMHVAGRAKEVGLPIVAEIMNAKQHMDAVKAITDAEGSAIKVVGAWRIWCEHAGGRAQVQGKALKPFTDSNPDHVFEIHPISQLGDIDLRKSYQPIKGYRPKDAHTAFLHYENVKCRITPGATTTTIRTSTAGYNIVKFKLESLEEPAKQKEVDNGRFVMCAVRDLDNELIVRKVRMAFVKGTPPEVKVKELAMGKRMTVLGIPRIDLALVAYRVAHKDDDTRPLTWNLPYEMIVVAVFPEEAEDKE
jgi:hypothetical protein